MRRFKKQYQTPSHPWQADRIAEEAILTKKYGLKNKKEIWRASSKLRNWRQQARQLVALPEDERAKVGATLFASLKKLGFLNEKSNIDDILGLKIEQVLDNRLQTKVFQKGLASTVNQARQLIVHKKVLVDGDVVNAPSYAVTVSNELSLVPGFKLVKPKVAEPVEVKDESTDEKPEAFDEAEHE